MSRKTALLLGTSLLLAGLGAPAADPPVDDFAKELKAMAGTWRPVFAENNGNMSPERDLKEIRWIRDEAGKWVLQRGDKAVLEWTVRRIDAMKKPKTIDVEITAGPHKGQLYQGIYELDGDTLRTCFAMPQRAERPTEFSARKGSLSALAEFKRVEK